MHYQFNFLFRGVQGTVEVSPVGAFVRWNGIGCQQEGIRNPAMNMAIFKARLEFSRLYIRSIMH